mmetsp:Transcript_37393/g.74753  ORF Transcript_37393/g.74753 Transcript_37393/m.74753 type:complete len:97 (+) Transcript_37393:763-1053(+)
MPTCHMPTGVTRPHRTPVPRQTSARLLRLAVALCTAAAASAAASAALAAAFALALGGQDGARATATLALAAALATSECPIGSPAAAPSDAAGALSL